MSREKQNTPTNTPTYTDLHQPCKSVQSGDCKNCNNHINGTPNPEETLQQLVENIVEVVYPLFEATWETIKKVIQVVLYIYPNKSVLHLAMHHPKERVRKKNIHRIMRWIDRGGKV